MNSVPDSKGAAFTIYETLKSTRSRPVRYWLPVDYATGKGRMLNNRTMEASQRRADQTRATMVKGQASRLTLSNGD